MARKSAKSKGYRKNNGKKPYLSRRDIVMLCALLVILAAGAVLLFSYDDGALKTKGGEIVDAGENWLIVNGAASGGKRYYKLGELDALEGFALDSDPMLSDDNLNTYKYSPEDESAGLRSINISTSAAGAERVSEYYHNQLSSAGLACSELSGAETDAGKYAFFTYTNAYYAEPAGESADEAAQDAAAPADGEAAAEDAAADAPEADAAQEDSAAEDASEAPEPNRFEQAVNAYIDANQRGSAIITAVYEFDSADDYLPDDALQAVVEEVIGAIRFERP